MKAILIFDNVNDLLFSKWDENFISRMKSFNGQEKDINITDSHHVSQLLSPIITSQRVMAAQFSNTYTSMQCKDNTTIVFDEWLDHVFMIISEDTVDDAHRELLDCKTLVQHICGQNINLLHSAVYQDWLSVLLESREKGDSIPGASGVIGESGVTAAALNALKTVSKEIKWSHQHYHLLLFVGDKMLALYSSRGCEDIMPPDLILLSIQCIAAQEYWQERREHEKSTECDNMHLPWLSEENSAIVMLCAGAGPSVPHSLHLAELAPRVVFVVLIDMDLRELGVAVQMSSQILSNLRRLLLQRNLEMLPNTLDSLEQAVKKMTDALRKNKSTSGACARVSGRMLELRRSCGAPAPPALPVPPSAPPAPPAPDSAAAALHAALEPALRHLKPDIPSLRMDHPLREARGLLAPHLASLRARAMRYFASESLPGGSPASHRYVEEFPGLIHFVYVDRGAGRFLAPDMADCADMLPPRTVRSALSLGLRVVREGYGAAAWRRGALHVCCVRWFERGAAPARPPAPPHPAAVRALPPPGDIAGAFYRQLVELSFPGGGGGAGVRELVCVHVGLLPAPTAVQQARRLAHALRDLAAAPAHHLL